MTVYDNIAVALEIQKGNNKDAIDKKLKKYWNMSILKNTKTVK